MESETNIAWYMKIESARNNIGDKGCDFLSRAGWKHLKEIKLGKNVGKQAIITSESQDSSISSGLTGLISIKLTSVTLFI